MAAKKSGFSNVKITKKKKVAEPVVEEVIETPVVEEEIPVSTVVEEETSDVQEIGLTKPQLSGKIVGNGSVTVVKQPRGQIGFEAKLASVPLFMVPEDIRRYLVSKGFGTNVWQRDKEWLERHGADMKMIEKLKQFLSGNL